MIALEGVSKTYRLSREVAVEAVRGVTLAVGPGEFVVITGRSGSGKTTLLNLAAGLTRPTAGRVLFAGQDLWRLADRQRSLLRNRRVGFVFQFPSLVPSLTALENVVLPRAFSKDGQDGGCVERAAALLGLVGLADRAASYPRQLSAGQQQRIVIARALMNEPEVLLADEPTSDLDERTEGEIMDLLARVHGERGVTVLLVTHTRQLVRYGTRAVEMAGGEIVG